MEVHYSLPPVDLRREDLEFLGREITKLFDPEAKEVVMFQSKVSATFGSGSNRIMISEKGVDEILKVSPLHKIVRELELDFHQLFKGPVSSRFLHISFDIYEMVEVKLEGAENWINQARGVLDPHLKEISNHRRLFRWITWVSVTTAITLPLFPREFAFILDQVDPSRQFFAYLTFPLVTITIVATALGYPFWYLFPLSTVTLGDKTVLPWYVRGGKSILSAAFTILLSIVGSLVFYYHIR